MLGPSLHALVLSAVLLGTLTLIGAPGALLLRRYLDASLVSTPIIGMAVFQIAAWYILDHTSIGIDPIVLPLLILSTVVAALVWWRSRTREEHDALGADRRLRVTMLLTAIFSSLVVLFQARNLLGLGHLTVASLGNVDLPDYSAVADLFSSDGFDAEGSIVGTDLGERGRTDVTGAYALLAYSVSVTGRHPWQVFVPMALVATILLTQSIARLFVRRTELPAYLIALIANVGITAPFFQYVMWQNYLSQLLGMAVAPLLFLLICEVMDRLGAPRSERLAHLAMLALVFVFLLFTYPHMFFLLPPVAILAAALSFDETPMNFARIVRAVAAVAVAGGMALLVVPVRAWLALERFLFLRHQLAGWEQEPFTPTDLFGLTGWIGDHATWGLVLHGFSGPTRWGSVLLSAFLVVEALRLSQRMWRHKERRWRLPVTGMVVAILGTYIIFVAIDGGVGYRQWKWISYFQPMLVALLIVPFLGWIVGRRRSHRPGWPGTISAVAIVLLLVVAGLISSLPITGRLGDESRVLIAPDGLEQIEHLSYDALTISLQERWMPPTRPGLMSHWDSMWVAHLVDAEAVHVLDRGYYVVSEPSKGPVLVYRQQVDAAPWVDPVWSAGGFALLPYPSEMATSRFPDQLQADLSVELTPGPDESVVATYELTNTGDASWIGHRNRSAGEVVLGLQTLDAAGRTVNSDYARVPLVDWPIMLPPNESVAGTFTLPARPFDHSVFIRFAPVAEHVGWLYDLGTVPLDFGSIVNDRTGFGGLLEAEKVVALDGSLLLNYTATNTGDVTWSGSHNSKLGEVTLRTTALDGDGSRLDWEAWSVLTIWPLSIESGQSIDGVISIRDLPDEALFVVLELVAEGVALFTDLGGYPTIVAVDPEGERRLTSYDGASAAEGLSLSGILTVELNSSVDFLLAGTFELHNSGPATWLGNRAGALGEVTVAVLALDAEGLETGVLVDRLRVSPLDLRSGDSARGVFSIDRRDLVGVSGLRFVPEAQGITRFDEVGFTPVDLIVPALTGADRYLVEALENGLLDDVAAGSVLVTFNESAQVDRLSSAIGVAGLGDRGYEVVGGVPPGSVGCGEGRLCDALGRPLIVVVGLPMLDDHPGSNHMPHTDVVYLRTPVAAITDNPLNPMIVIGHSSLFGPGNALPICNMDDPSAGAYSGLGDDWHRLPCVGAPANISTFTTWLQQGCTEGLRGWYICAAD